MSMSGAERQARYRERQKAARVITTEEAIEAARKIMVEQFVRDVTDDAALAGLEPDAAERCIANVRDVTAKPLWPPGGFDAWLERVLVREIEEQLSAAKRNRRRGRKNVT